MIEKIITVIGARPQFIKAAVISREILKFNNIEEVIIHTGQHFDVNMSDVFFQQMGIPKPKYNLNIHSLSHGAMTGRMISDIEEILLKENPKLVLVYGDTNSTLAAALAAKKLHIKVAHVEAGLRSYNMKMPEEVNRILTDRISDLLFCPTKNAVENLTIEGFHNFNCQIHLVGDVMYDATKFFVEYARNPFSFPIDEKFALVTLHRAENTDDKKRLTNIVEALNLIADKMKLIFPVHPRTKKILKENNISISHSNIQLIDPVGYFEMLFLIKNSELILTDSGGLQKEAYFLKKPCLTLREETEWVELVKSGCNKLCGADKDKIISCFDSILSHSLDFSNLFYGEGNASVTIVNKLDIF